MVHKSNLGGLQSVLLLLLFMVGGNYDPPLSNTLYLLLSFVACLPGHLNWFNPNLNYSNLDLQGEPLEGVSRHSSMFHSNGQDPSTR